MSAPPILVCCTPWMAPYVSGHHWTHAKSCPTPDRNQKVRPHIVTEQVAARLEHPAGADLASATGLQAWLSHPDGCLCAHCVFVNGNLDRDDDTAFEGSWS